MEDAKKAMERFDIKQQFQETEGSVCPCAHTLVLSLLHGEFAESHALDTRIWASLRGVCHLPPSPLCSFFFSQYHLNESFIPLSRCPKIINAGDWPLFTKATFKKKLRMFTKFNRLSWKMTIGLKGKKSHGIIAQWELLLQPGISMVEHPYI